MVGRVRSDYHGDWVWDVMQYRIYYGDGTTFEGPVEEAPAVDVQVVVVADQRGSPYELGRKVLKGWDWYACYETDWVGFNGAADLADHVLYNLPRIKRILKGRMLPKEQWEALLKQAAEDPGFPRKSARDPNIEDGLL